MLQNSRLSLCCQWIEDPYGESLSLEFALPSIRRCSLYICSIRAGISGRPSIVRVAPYVVPLDAPRAMAYGGISQMRKKRELIVTTTFERNRLEEQNLIAAYELVLPVKQTVRARTERTQQQSTSATVEQLDIFHVSDKGRIAL